MDCSLPFSFVYGIFQARVLEWIAILAIPNTNVIDLESTGETSL